MNRRRADQLNKSDLGWLVMAFFFALFTHLGWQEIVFGVLIWIAASPNYHWFD